MSLASGWFALPEKIFMPPDSVIFATTTPPNRAQHQPKRWQPKRARIVRAEKPGVRVGGEAVETGRRHDTYSRLEVAMGTNHTRVLGKIDARISAFQARSRSPTLTRAHGVCTTSSNFNLSPPAPPDVKTQISPSVTATSIYPRTRMIPVERVSAHTQRRQAPARRIGGRISWHLRVYSGHAEMGLRDLRLALVLRRGVETKNMQLPRRRLGRIRLVLSQAIVYDRSVCVQ